MSSEADLFGGGDKAKADLSPMIDLVFLLLIFFMVTANMITYPKDPEVDPPIASASKVPELVEGRVVMNIYKDGKIVDIFGKSYSTTEFTALMRRAKDQNPKTRLHLRAHKDVPYRHIKRASQASADGGVITVIFSTYLTSK